jgi:hypothetical protein
VQAYIPSAKGKIIIVGAIVVLKQKKIFLNKI